MPPVFPTERNESDSAPDEEPSSHLMGAEGLQISIPDEEAALNVRIQEHIRLQNEIADEPFPPINNNDDAHRHMDNVRRRVNDQERRIFAEIRTAPLPAAAPPGYPGGSQSYWDKLKGKMKQHMRQVREQSEYVLQKVANMIIAALRDPKKVAIFVTFCAGLGIACKYSGMVILSQFVGPLVVGGACVTAGASLVVRNSIVRPN